MRTVSKSVHASTMDAAQRLVPGERADRCTFGTAGGQHYRCEQEQRREGDVEKEERDAAREWLKHLDDGRLG